MRFLLPALAVAIPAVIAVSIATALPVSAQSASAGAVAYKRCAACHLGNGAGVPGAFPPLRGDVRVLAGTPAGRRYLVLAVTRGVSGPITVEGKAYRGVMPLQAGLGDDQVAGVLNHVLATSAKGKGAAKPFAAAEVAQHRASGAALNPAAVGKLRAAAAGR